MTPAPVFGMVPSPLDEAGVLTLIARETPAAGPALIVTPNLDHIVQLRRNAAFRAAYRGARLVLCDGFPVQYYARLRGHPAHRVTGSDLIARLMAAAQPGRRMMFVVDEAATALAVKRWAATQGLADEVETLVPGYGFIGDATGCAGMVDAIRQFRPDIMVMAVGAPQSEIFVDRYRDALPPCWALCVGQGVKMALGLVGRAPPVVRRLHGEWLWRLAQEPRRLGARYGLGAFRFAAAIVDDLRGSAAS